MGFVDEIIEHMKDKTTGELISIWTKNDRTKWSDSSFEAIKQVLTKRGVPLPQQNLHTTLSVTSHDRATAIDIIISIIFPLGGIVVGLIALCKGEKKRAITMFAIGICITILQIIILGIRMHQALSSFH
jgi:hypothetical protein